MTNSKFVYRFTPAKKMTDKITAMAAVQVYELATDKKIGGYAWSRMKPAESDIEYMVSEIIREHETRKVWAKV